MCRQEKAPVRDGIFLHERAERVSHSLEYFDDTHHVVRQRVREFVERHVKPFVEVWEEKGEFPEDLYRQAGAAGVLGVGYPEQYGGTGGDLFAKIACVEELMRCGSAGVVAGLGSLDISIPPILFLGTEEQRSALFRPFYKETGYPLSGSRNRARALMWPPSAPPP